MPRGHNNYWIATYTYSCLSIYVYIGFMALQTRFQNIRCKPQSQASGLSFTSPPKKKSLKRMGTMSLHILMAMKIIPYAMSKLMTY